MYKTIVAHYFWYDLRITELCVKLVTYQKALYATYHLHVLNSLA